MPSPSPSALGSFLLKHNSKVKCFENNGLIAEILEENGEGRVLVVDGGGAVRRALIDAELAQSKGIKFYIGNEKVWLSDYISPEFIKDN